MSARNRKRISRLAALLAATAMVAVLGTAGQGWADDRDLLISGRVKPYLFIILDSSGSMNLKIGTDEAPALGFGDDPDSRIYAAKEALFQVFADRDDVHFGFATFDQDRLQVQGKHYLYPIDAAARKTLDDNKWPIKNWPLADPEGDPLVTVGRDCDGDGLNDGTSTKCFGGDALVFGPTFDRSMPLATDGTCFEPVDLATERDRVNAFARLGALGDETTVIWVQDNPVLIGKGASEKNIGGEGEIYRLTFQPGTGGGAVGDPMASLSVTFIAEQLDESAVAWPSGCSAPGFLPAVTAPNVMLTMDPLLNQFLMIDNPGPDAEIPEETAGHWLVADGSSIATCGNSKPFTGQGWEGNYDSGAQIAGNATFNDQATNEDPVCVPALQDGTPVGVLPDATDPNSCVEVRPLRPTKISPLGRFADSGDMLPFDWDDNNKDELLRRLAPNYPFGTPDFGVSRHLTDQMSRGADGSGPEISLAPRLPGRPPIIATGPTPLGKAMLDFRCWYTGNQDNNKCEAINETAFVEGDGWSGAACTLDPEFACRRPFLILISDGADNCPGNAPTSDISDLKTKTGVKTWALNLGSEDHCSSGGPNNVLHSVTTAGAGECVNIKTKEGLLDTLEQIAETIAASARTFAAAAVPTVQSNANTRLFLSNFRGVPDASTWDGHLSAYWKPLPVKDGAPDPTDKFCEQNEVAPGRDPDGEPGDGCHLWDAGVVLRDEQLDATDPLDPSDPDKRRVYYSRQTTSGNWPNVRRLLDPTAGDGGDLMDVLRYDLWRAFELIPRGTPNNAFDPVTEAALEDDANDTIAAALAKQTETLSDGTEITYVLGDIFHSQPALVEAPPNTRFFAENAGAPDTSCVASEAAGNFDRGYRCFLERHLRRRRVLLVGANDGMLHAFDAGTYEDNPPTPTPPDDASRITCQPGSDPPTTDGPCGTGRELWAYMPRTVMPSVRERSLVDGHKFSVDATPSVGDVFIDPLHAGTPSPGERLWRTVAITGLREGGSGYFALDITQPDLIQDVDPDPADNRRVFVPLNPPVGAVADCGASPPPAGCGPVPYPSALWEFTDSTADSFIAVPPALPVPMDEDANGAPDLGDTWSQADIGRIRVCGGSDCDPTVPDNDLVDRYVAVFTGGMDRLNKAFDPRYDADPGVRGAFLYMVDIETGKVLYKRRLDASAPSSPAAVDTNQDGYINRIYAATLGGSLYRVDLDVDPAGNLPGLTPVNGLRDLSGAIYDDVPRISVDSAGDPVWVPRKIFDTNRNDSTSGASDTTEPRPIYHPPSVFFVAELGLYGVAFGTGDREDLWGRTPEGDSGDLQEGRFYLFVDDTEQVDPADLPLTEEDFELIDLFNFDPDTGNLLVTRPLGQKGWYVVLGEKERVSAQAFNLLGVTFFSSFEALIDTSSGKFTCDEDDIKNDNRCSKSGISKVFVTSTINAQPFIEDDEGNPYIKITGAFVSAPFTEIGYSSEGGGGDGGGGGPNDTPEPPAPGDLDEEERAVMDAIRKLFPQNCRFTNQRIDVRLVTSDTKVRRIAAVPVCVIEKNWREY